jgi:hypothetical protein
LTHIAGVRLDVCGRVIQRCSLCGFKLIDSVGEESSLSPDGSNPHFPSWETGRLIRVSGENPIQSVILADSDRLPADSCIDLIE